MLIALECAESIAYRHGHLSNAIEQDHQQPKEGEPCDLLPVIGADRVHMGA